MRTLLLSAAIVLAASTGAATTIAITGGSADVVGATGAAQFSITGDGVSFTGQGFVTPTPCHDLCSPGSSFFVNTGISGEDRGISGTVIFGGNTFNYVALPGLGTTAGLGFDYVLTIPQVGTPGPATITLTAPFTASGGIIARDFNGGEPLMMEGQGTATIVLSLAFPTAYKLQSAHYEFTAVPEPGTAVLILIGFAGVSFGILSRGFFRAPSKFGVPRGIRTLVTAVKGRCPRPTRRWGLLGRTETTLALTPTLPHRMLAHLSRQPRWSILNPLA